MKSNPETRPSPIAGQWYPADPSRLAASVDGYLDACEPVQLPGEVIAVMAPHAGHIYSGPVAAYAFKTLSGLPIDLAAVIAPMHHPYWDPLLTTAHKAYRTPLGDVPVDQQALGELNAALDEELGYQLTAVTRDPEHSLEIEIPFLQRVLPPAFKLLPVMVRDQRANVARSLGKALAQVLKGGRRSWLPALTCLISTRTLPPGCWTRKSCTRWSLSIRMGSYSGGGRAWLRLRQSSPGGGDVGSQRVGCDPGDRPELRYFGRGERRLRAGRGIRCGCIRARELERIQCQPISKLP
jgi:hypothetical protein